MKSADIENIVLCLETLTYTRQYMISIIKRTTDADHAFVIENGMGPILGEGMAYYRDAPHPHVFWPCHRLRANCMYRI